MSEFLLSKKILIRNKAIILLISVVISVVLPQIFHFAGNLSGQGTAVGASFLPMHIPVFVAGLMAGPVVGLLVGLISPILSFAISGMPTANSLPFMIIELASYGLFSGIIKNCKSPTLFKVVCVQIAGRAVRALAIVIAIFVLDSITLSIQSTWSVVISGLMGILLQWALIPLVIYRMKGLNKNYERH